MQLPSFVGLLDRSALNLNENTKREKDEHTLSWQETQLFHPPTLTHNNDISTDCFFLKIFVYLFLERGREKERERNIDV